MEIDERKLSGVENVASLLGVTARTLRFYEEKGLISPSRVGRVRIYTAEHIAALRIVFRGKLLGLSLRDIEQFLRIHEQDDRQSERRSEQRFQRDAYISLLESQQQAITLSLGTLRALNGKVVA